MLSSTLQHAGQNEKHTDKHTFAICPSLQALQIAYNFVTINEPLNSGGLSPEEHEHSPDNNKACR